MSVLLAGVLMTEATSLSVKITTYYYDEECTAPTTATTLEFGGVADDAHDSISLGELDRGR